jgi:hypothetical protein
VRAEQGGKIKVNIHEFSDTIGDTEFASRFVRKGVAPETYGEAANNRIMRQSPEFSGKFPQGSTIPPSVIKAPANSYWYGYPFTL